MPEWELDFVFAEQFHINPETVPDVVSVLTWERWKLRERAHAARRAYERSKLSGEWARDLSPAECEAMAWASDEDDASSN